MCKVGIDRLTLGVISVHLTTPPQLHSLLEPTQSPNPKPRSTPNQAARLIWLCLTLEKLLGLMSFLWLVFYIHIWIDIYIVAYVFEIVTSNVNTWRLYFFFKHKVWFNFLMRKNSWNNFILLVVHLLLVTWSTCKLGICCKSQVMRFFFKTYIHWHNRATELHENKIVLNYNKESTTNHKKHTHTQDKDTNIIALLILT